jgi:MFS family permease
VTVPAVTTEARTAEPVPVPMTAEPMTAEPMTAAARTTFAEVFAVTEFRALWFAQLLSICGDQLARVALTLLVYRQTHSTLLAAGTFAASSVPMFVGGLTLSVLADRLPRRQVMIACDLSRAVLVVLMALPGLPLVAQVTPLFLVTLISAPFSSARAALNPDILTGDRYVLGSAITLTTIQFAQVVGYAVGGAVAGCFGLRTSLLADAATFVGSALITRLWVHARPAARPARAKQPGTQPGTRSGIRSGFRLVFGDPRLRLPMLLGWLAASYNVSDGVAAPLGHALGGGDVAAGLILAASALGASLGAVLFSRLVAPGRRRRWMSPLATASCAVPVLFVFGPALPETLVILTVGGLFSCYQLAASAAFVTSTPASQRSQAFGIAQGGLSLGQGAAMIAAGGTAQHYSPAAVIAVSGLLGVIAAITITLTGPRGGAA